MNDNSDIEGNRSARASNFLGDSYQCYLKEEYSFDNYDFDYVHICLSPQYIYPDHWHYFSMFISTYEEFSGNESVIYTEKYETHVCHQKIHDEFLQESSIGRKQE
jgi:hypothetical protein